MASSRPRCSKNEIMKPDEYNEQEKHTSTNTLQSNASSISKNIHHSDFANDRKKFQKVITVKTTYVYLVLRENLNAKSERNPQNSNCINGNNEVAIIVDSDNEEPMDITLENADDEMLFSSTNVAETEEMEWDEILPNTHLYCVTSVASTSNEVEPMDILPISIKNELAENEKMSDNLILCSPSFSSLTHKNTRRTFYKSKESENLDIPENDMPAKKGRVLHKNAFSDDNIFVAYYNSSYGKKNMRKRTFSQMNESENLDIADDDQPPIKRRVLHQNAFTDD